jgi:hypothetical protein
MLQSRWRWLVASGLLALYGFVPPVAAQENPAKAAVVKLLAIGWETTPQARVAADEQYQVLRQHAGDHPIALSASLLVLLQQRRYDEAAKRADDLLEKSPGDLLALRAKVWLAIVLKNYSAALSSAEQLSEQLAAAPPKDDLQQASHDELYGFLGRVYGFLGGAAAESVSQDDRKASERRVLERIAMDRQPIFEEARDGVVAKFVELTSEQDEQRERAASELAAAKDETLKDVAAEKQAIADRADELDSRRTKVNDELKAELEEIAREDQPLLQEFSRLDARAGILNRDLLRLDIQFRQLESDAAREKDPVLRQQLLREADRLSIIASGVESDLIALNRLADGVRAQRAALLARQQKAQAAAAQTVNRTDQEMRDLAKRDKRNEAIGTRVARTKATPPSMVRALAAQATAFSTYDQFPLEVARSKLLERVR